jgi:hypothetical protein
MSNVKTLHERAEQILAAYESAIGDRDPGSIDTIGELLPAVTAKMPDATVPEIIKALEMGSRRAAHEASALERYRRAKFGPR